MHEIVHGFGRMHMKLTELDMVQSSWWWFDGSKVDDMEYLRDYKMRSIELIVYSFDENHKRLRR